MQRDIPIGLAAGLAAALLVLAILSGSMLGFALLLLAPLPVTLATLSWGSRSGLVAAATAIAILAGLAGIRLGLAFGVSMALPAWGLAYLALAGFAATDKGQGRISLGSLIVVAALLSTFSALFTMLSMGTSYENVVESTEKALQEMLRDAPVPAGTDTTAFVHNFSRLMLPMSATLTTIMSAGGLWLSGRIARMSGRLPRPWPDVAALRLPHWLPILLGGACVVSLLPGVFGFAGQLLLCSLIGAFIVQGFAVAHYATRGNAARPMILGLVYLLLLFLSWIVLALVALLGLIDLFFNIRGLPGGRSQSPNTTN